ncbi:glycosyltransferase [Mucilaginibacter celer]|uniref:Glycosyltransferase n=1 Tax=Mucilaginibacter celer TaxID=2305508 RepID=A0A494W127_9SPHI|nr:glycosyltransferase [Mucilaginibacter celer]AYL97248.1 glycosyltransferase [Mucilaginibacter celer]
MADQAGISVIICTYNGASQLPQTLRHLALQQVPAEISWEIIVVDNNSADDTFNKAKQIWEAYKLPQIKYTVLSEPKPGKHHALTTGVHYAGYEYIVICDDDNRLADNYIKEAYFFMEANSAFGAAGGQGIVAADVEIPAWFWQHQRSYAVGKQNPVSGDVTANGYLWGAGMVFRKSLYIKVYSSIPAILAGPDGSGAGRGEDVELCMRFILAGYRLYYHDELVFTHYMHSNRLGDTYRLQHLNLNPNEERILNLYRKQIQLNKLSGAGKLLLLCTSLFRYLFSKTLAQTSKWHYLYEAEIFFLLSGIKLSQLAAEVAGIRKLNQILAK